MQAAQDEAVSGLAEEKAEPKRKDKGAALRFEVSIAKADGVEDAAALVKAIARELNLGGAACATAAGELRIKLTIDHEGKILAVLVIRTTDQAAAACVRSKLLAGVSSTAKAKGKTGTIELTVKIAT